MDYVNVTSQVLSAAAGVVVSIMLMLLPIIPSWDVWWRGITGEQKQAINVLVLLFITFAIALLSCTTNLAFIKCTQAGIFNLVVMFISAAVGNTTAYTATNRLMDGLVGRFRG